MANWIKSNPIPFTVIFRPPLQRKTPKLHSSTFSCLDLKEELGVRRSPHEAALRFVGADFRVFAVLEGLPHVFGGIPAVLHRHQQRVCRHLLPQILARLTGDLCTKRQAGGGEKKS